MSTYVRKVKETREAAESVYKRLKSSQVSIYEQHPLSVWKLLLSTKKLASLKGIPERHKKNLRALQFGALGLVETKDYTLHIQGPAMGVFPVVNNDYRVEKNQAQCSPYRVGADAVSRHHPNVCVHLSSKVATKNHSVFADGRIGTVKTSYTITFTPKRSKEDIQSVQDKLSSVEYVMVGAMDYLISLAGSIFAHAYLHVPAALELANTDSTEAPYVLDKADESIFGRPFVYSDRKVSLVNTYFSCKHHDGGTILAFAKFGKFSSYMDHPFTGSGCTLSKYKPKGRLFSFLAVSSQAYAMNKAQEEAQSKKSYMQDPKRLKSLKALSQWVVGAPFYTGNIESAFEFKDKSGSIFGITRDLSKLDVLKYRSVPANALALLDYAFFFIKNERSPLPDANRFEFPNFAASWQFGSLLSAKERVSPTSILPVRLANIGSFRMPQRYSYDGVLSLGGPKNKKPGEFRYVEHLLHNSFFGTLFGLLDTSGTIDREKDKRTHTWVNHLRELTENYAYEKREEFAKIMYTQLGVLSKYSVERIDSLKMVMPAALSELSIFMQTLRWLYTSSEDSPQIHSAKRMVDSILNEGLKIEVTIGADVMDVGEDGISIAFHPFYEVSTGSRSLRVPLGLNIISTESLGV